MMGPKDYNAIAGKLSVLVKYALTRREKQLLLGVADQIASYCAGQNPNFQRERFMEATGTSKFVGEDT